MKRISDMTYEEICRELDARGCEMPQTYAPTLEEVREALLEYRTLDHYAAVERRAVGLE